MDVRTRRISSPWVVTLAALALVATLALTAPAFSGTSLPKLAKQVKKLKKKVKKISKQEGPQGPQGPRGLQGPAGDEGATGSAGPSATFARITGIPSAGVNWGSPSGTSSPNIVNPSIVAMVSPSDIVARDLRVLLRVSVSGTQSRTFTLLDDGAATGVTCTVSAGGDGQTCSSTGTATIAAGSEIAVQQAPANSPPVSDAEIGWRATTP
jgi:hypothetical protein